MTTTDKLFIYFTDRTADTVQWVWLNEKGEKTQSTAPCLLADCPKPSNNSQVIFLFPAEDMLLTTLTLPPVKPAQLGSAALYALEEKLAEDVQDLHAVALPAPEANVFTAGIIRTALLEAWLEKFKSADMTVHILLPDIFGLPYHEHHWTVLFSGQRALVRTGLYQGFAVPLDDYALFLSKQAHPEIILLPPETTLADVCSNALGAAKFNLCQGKYRPKTPWLDIQKTWRLPVILSLIWIVLLTALLIWRYMTLSAENTRLDAQISTLYHQIYPDATAIISPKARLSRELKQLQGASQHQSALALMAKTGEVLKQLPSIQIDSLNFRDDTLRINIQAQNFQILAKAVDLLNKNQLAVTQSGAARAGEKVMAALSIKLLEKK